MGIQTVWKKCIINFEIISAYFTYQGVSKRSEAFFDEKGKMLYLNPVVPQLFFMMTVVLLIRNHFLTMFA